VANKKLIKDLQGLIDYPDQCMLESYIASIAGRALEEIEYLENQIEYLEAELGIGNES